MSWMRYYRTNRADVLAARARDMSGNAFVEGRGQAFADKFGGTAMFTRGFAPHFAGITFTKTQQPANPELWTKPSQQQVLCRPKDKGIARHHQQRSWELRREWNAEMEAIKEICKVRDSEALAVIGVTPDMISGDHSLTFFTRGEWAYVASTLRLVGLEEITGSVFVAAADEPPVGKDAANAPPKENNNATA